MVRGAERPSGMISTPLAWRRQVQLRWDHGRRPRRRARPENTKTDRDALVSVPPCVHSRFGNRWLRSVGPVGRFRTGEPFRPWLLAIVANEARNRRRSQGRRAALTLRAAAEPAARGEDPEDAAFATERRERLLNAVERLREDDRDVLACRYFLELSEEETAAALGIARGTVKSRTHRALVRLQEELG